MSEPTLSQAEVDALMGGQDGPSPTPQRDATDIAYDIASQERIVRGRMLTMEIVNERFSRNFRLGLFNFIRRSPEVSVGPLAVQKFSAFLRDLSMPTSFNIVSVRPLRGNGLVVVEPALLFGLIESLYGGTGKIATRVDGRDFSAAELRVVRRLVDLACEEYKKAWKNIYPLELHYQRTEVQPQFANIAATSEMVVTTSFKLKIGEQSGAIHFCIPYSTLEPIRDVLYSTVQGDAMEADHRWVRQLTQEIQAAEVTLVAELGQVNSNVEQLMSLEPGDFLEVDLKSLIQAKVDGVPILECHYGTHNGHYAIKVDRALCAAAPNWMENTYGN